jgi:hypothetical protein
MPKVTSLFLTLMILQLLLYGYILVLELPPRFTKASLKGPPTLLPSSDADPPGCTSAVSTPSEAEASEAFAPAAEVVAPPEEALEDELIELGHAFLDHLAQLNFSSGPPS